MAAYMSLLLFSRFQVLINKCGKDLVDLDKVAAKRLGNEIGDLQISSACLYTGRINDGLHAWDLSCPPPNRGILVTS
jgi:hypothetical protein